MPTAREALLYAALTALSELPWSGIRMVDVAVAAGVSRQTLYNEFGSKEGLARALVRREADSYIHGIDRILSRGRAADCAERLAVIAEWTVSEARARPLLYALLTGCWGERLPAPRAGLSVSRAVVPAQRRADAGHPAPEELVAAVRDRIAAVFEHEGRGRTSREDPVELARRCELAVRLALSCVVAPPPGSGPGVGSLVRHTVGGVGGTGAARGAGGARGGRGTGGVGSPRGIGGPTGAGDISGSTPRAGGR
ncbi:TetR/AcrR family transcriptional regulator [Streptomyces sp. SCSIO 30461]|uniref:TetR/AcrR family transcriptional regulator n=1 Tax=Streptomyces sp. SCSIO 30461 TaxID=3118085 RepID=UPI0030D44A00